MSEKSTQIKDYCKNVLHSANVLITPSQETEYYFVLRTVYSVSQDNMHKFTMDIKHGRMGTCLYTITMDNGEKFSCRARPDAVFFHRPVADDVLEVERAIKLRHLIQKTSPNLKRQKGS